MSILTGKRALVCGSTQGIGLACAQELAKAGAAVTLAARNPDKLAETVASLPAVEKGQHGSICADFSNPQDVRAEAKKLIAAVGTHQILVNNTGGPSAGPIVDATPEQFITAITQHVICNQLLTQTLMGGMKEAGYGRVINIISLSVKAPIAGLGVSNTTRGAVASWAKTMAGELGPLGITVNNVLPGYTATDRLSELMDYKADKMGIASAELQKQWEAEIPARRFARPEEIAAAVVFLASPAASYVNGINLPVDGGRLPTL